MKRFWFFLPPVLLPLVAVLLFPSLAHSAWGGALLAGLGVAAWAAVAEWRLYRLNGALEKVAQDLEAASRSKYARWVTGEDWGPLASLAPSVNWLLQEVQGSLKSLESGLADETARLEALIHAIPDGVIMANLRGEVLYINSPAARMLGVPESELTRREQGVYELVHQDRLRSTIARILEKRARHDVVELAIDAGKGEHTRTFISSVQLVSNPDLEDVGVLITLRDVTTERELERVKGDFFQAVAHDLRAPLLGIQGYVRMVEKARPAAEKEKAYFRSIYQSCDRIFLLIQDILDLARLEAGTATLDLSPVRPFPLLKRVHALFLPLAEEKGVELVLDLPALEPAPIQVDERLVERSIHNLVQNAVKFTPKGGRVTMLISVEEKGYVFAVEDTGPGIPPEQLQAVFDKFRQLEGAHARSGFGLGLTIAKQAVEAHGGRIWAESKAPSGGGARIQFLIPLTRVVEGGAAAGRDPRD